MNKPIQYLLVGYPYSGKTTLAKKLETLLDFKHINIDELKYNKGYKTEGDDDVPNHVWEEIFKEADLLIESNLLNGKSIVNEYAWTTKYWRDRARNVAKNIGFETIIIFLDIPKEIILKRWQDNENSKSRFQWPENEFKRYLYEFEKLSPEENYIICDQSIPTEQWIKEKFLSTKFSHFSRKCMS